jgi:signal transduction histidine kinase
VIGLLRSNRRSKSGSQPDTVQSVLPESTQWNTLFLNGEPDPLLEKLEQRLASDQYSNAGGVWDTAVNSLSDGLCVTDSRGIVTAANRSAEAILDRCTGPLVGSNLINLLQTMASDRSAIDDNTDHRASRLLVMSQRLVCEIRRGTETSDGVLRVTRTLLDWNRESDGFVWSIRDVTQQKLIEEVREQFVHTATHELRTPLGSLKACAETLAMTDDIDIEQQKMFCNLIHSEATRLARFVDELLDVSQMEGGALQIARQDVDFERLIEEVVTQVLPQMEQKQQHFERIIPPKLPKLTGDKDKLSGTLINLLANACKYTPRDGQITLEVEWDRSGIDIHVQDTGYGISEADLPRVFDKFFRSEDTRIRHTIGTGIGLSFASEVARLHGGRLSVHSELDKGSRFTLWLPVSG